MTNDCTRQQKYIINFKNLEKRVCKQKPTAGGIRNEGKGSGSGRLCKRRENVALTLNCSWCCCPVAAYKSVSSFCLFMNTEVDPHMAYFQPTPQEKSRRYGASQREAFDRDDNDADVPFCTFVYLVVFKLSLVVMSTYYGLSILRVSSFVQKTKNKLKGK